MSHICHAQNCTKEVPPKLFMCSFHWRMVSDGLQRQVWKHYRKGQEKDKNPSIEYLKAHYAAVNQVAAKEGEPVLMNVRGRIDFHKRAKGLNK